MDKTAEDLKQRTKRFALDVMAYCETLPNTVEAQGLRRQLNRAGLGVVGNYRSACRPRSHAEFTARYALALDESDECELWFDIATEKGWGDMQSRNRLLDESGQLRAILSRGYVTARSRDRS